METIHDFNLDNTFFFIKTKKYTSVMFVSSPAVCDWVKMQVKPENCPQLSTDKPASQAGESERQLWAPFIHVHRH